MGIFRRDGGGKKNDRPEDRSRSEITRDDLRGEKDYRPGEATPQGPSYKDMNEEQAKRFFALNQDKLVYLSALLEHLMRNPRYRDRLEPLAQRNFDLLIKSRSLREALQNQHIQKLVREAKTKIKPRR